MSRNSISGLPAAPRIPPLFVLRPSSYADRPCKNGHKPPCGPLVQAPVVVPHPGPVGTAHEGRIMLPVRPTVPAGRPLRKGAAIRRPNCGCVSAPALAQINRLCPLSDGDPNRCLPAMWVGGGSGGSKKYCYIDGDLLN